MMFLVTVSVRRKFAHCDIILVGGCGCGCDSFAICGILCTYWRVVKALNFVTQGTTTVTGGMKVSEVLVKMVMAMVMVVFVVVKACAKECVW